MGSMLYLKIFMNLKKVDSINSIETISIRSNSSCSNSSLTDSPKKAWINEDKIINENKIINEDKIMNNKKNTIKRLRDKRVNNRSPQISDVLKYLTFLNKTNKVE